MFLMGFCFILLNLMIFYSLQYLQVKFRAIDEKAVYSPYSFLAYSLSFLMSTIVVII
jgi:hypothetical protein